MGRKEGSSNRWADFIGSYLCEKLSSLGSYVVIFDIFSSGKYENVEEVLKKCADEVCLLKGDCTRPNDVKKAVSDVDVVFRFAANPEVRLDLSDPKNYFEQNIYATHVLLEALRQNCDA